MIKINIICLFRFQFNLPNELCILIYNMKKELEENESRNYHIFCNEKYNKKFNTMIHPFDHYTGEIPGFWLHYKPINNNDMNYLHIESEYHFNYDPENDNIKICKKIENLSALNVIKDIKHYEYLINYYYQNLFVPYDELDELDDEPLDAINCVRYCKKKDCIDQFYLKF